MSLSSSGERKPFDSARGLSLVFQANSVEGVYTILYRNWYQEYATLNFTFFEFSSFCFVEGVQMEGE
jgi:hypothetical protein